MRRTGHLQPLLKNTNSTDSEDNDTVITTVTPQPDADDAGDIAAENSSSSVTTERHTTDDVVETPIKLKQRAIHFNIPLRSRENSLDSVIDDDENTSRNVATNVELEGRLIKVWQ